MDSKDLLHRWLKRLRESSFAHYKSEEIYSGLHSRIGVPAAVMSAVVGTSVFAALDTAVDIRIKILVGIMGIATAILTGLQTFLRFSDRAEQHRKTAIEYGIIRRYIEQLLTDNKGVSHEVVDDIRKKIDALASNAPTVSETIWAKAINTAGSDFFLSVREEQSSADASGRNPT